MVSFVGVELQCGGFYFDRQFFSNFTVQQCFDRFIYYDMLKFGCVIKEVYKVFGRYFI